MKKRYLLKKLWKCNVPIQEKHLNYFPSSGNEKGLIEDTFQ